MGRWLRCSSPEIHWLESIARIWIRSPEDREAGIGAVDILKYVSLQTLGVTAVQGFPRTRESGPHCACRVRK